MNGAEDKLYDFIVVGSGPGAVMAAQTATESGQSVLMVDVGFTDSYYKELPSAQNFVDLRKSDPNQFKYFLGDDFEAVPSPEITTGAQLTPARRHLLNSISDFCPVISENFIPMESLALGGLGAGWGLGTYVYSDLELQKTGLPIIPMRLAYQKVANRIGISCGNDDLKNEISLGLENTQQALNCDNSVALLQKKYLNNKAWFQKNNLSFGSPSLALLSNPFGERKAENYSDMNFYTETGQSAWRPYITINYLNGFQNFKYLSGFYAMKFVEIDGIVNLTCKNIELDSEVVFCCKNLLLGAGALGSARIVLRSLDVVSLPLLCNPYTYMPALNLSMLGKIFIQKKYSMAQAMMLYKPDNDDSKTVSVALYTYQSLLLMRLIQQSPLNIKDNLKLFQWLYPAFIIAGIHHPDMNNQNRTLSLIPNEKSKTKDALSVHFEITDNQLDHINKHEKVIQKALRKMGVIAIKKINPGFGSSIHYGGTLPISFDNSLGSSQNNGLVNGTKHVFTVDGSSFSFLPAKGITFSIMANAHRVVENILNHE